VPPPPVVSVNRIPFEPATVEATTAPPVAVLMASITAPIVVRPLTVML
jgi:hypothetical protein